MAFSLSQFKPVSPGFQAKNKETGSMFPAAGRFGNPVNR
jgi:hypothetical protein